MSLGESLARPRAYDAAFPVTAIDRRAHGSRGGGSGSLSEIPIRRLPRLSECRFSTQYDK